MNLTSILQIVQLGLNLAPSVVTSVQTLFAKVPAATTPEAKAAQSATKAQAALNMAVAGISAALGLDPAAFGDPEKALIVGVHNDVVAYFNAKGWPVT